MKRDGANGANGVTGGTPAPAFEALRLCYTYPTAPRPAISDVSLRVPAGRFQAILGPNGSGKSTLGRLLLGSLVPATGSVAVAGRPLDQWTRRALARQIGVVPQDERHAFPLTVHDLVEMGRYPHLGPFGAPASHDRDVVRTAMERCDVLPFADRAITTLSGGERQRVLIARALAQEPSALLLDEPSASLDIRHEMSIFELLRELVGEGVTVVLITHNLNLAARYADRLLLLHDGRARAEGRPAEVLREELLRTVYGWPVTVAPHPGPGPDAGAPQVLPLSEAR